MARAPQLVSRRDVNSPHSPSSQDAHVLNRVLDCGPLAPLSVGFSRRECWRGLPCPSLGSSQPRDRTRVSCIRRQILYHQATGGNPSGDDFLLEIGRLLISRYSRCCQNCSVPPFLPPISRGARRHRAVMSLTATAGHALGI